MEKNPVLMQVVKYKGKRWKVTKIFEGTDEVEIKCLVCGARFERVNKSVLTI